jgi:hypothetical protein
MPPLTAGHVVRGALSTYRERFLVVVLTAICIFGPAAAVTAAVTLWAEDQLRQGSVSDILVGAVVLAASVVSSLGLVFYPALLDRIVGAHRYGHEHHELRHVFRTLPYLKLVAADLLFVAATAVGSALLVLPGVIAFTLFAIVGPMITIEGRGVLDAFRRSAQLILPRFWLTIVIVTGPAFTEHALVHGIEHALHGTSVVAALVVGALVGASVLALIALIEVTLAHELVARDRAGSPG